MKNVFYSLMILLATSSAFAEGSMVGGGDGPQCKIATAVSKAYQITDAIVSANGFDMKQTYDHAITEDENYYYIGRSYDQGLSIPTYTVRITKGSCLILDVRYSNNEG